MTTSVKEGASAPGCLFSIVIPTRNSETLVEACVDSVVQQTFSDFEIIIVDGASTDGTPALIRKLAAENKKIRWVSEKDSGVYDAMNKGIALARGRWLLFLGADDLLHANTVLNQVAPHLNETVDFVYGNVRWIPASGDGEGTLYNGEFSAADLAERNICHQSIFYSRLLFEVFGNYDLRYTVFADWELNLRLFNRVRKKFLPVTVADFHGGGLSAGNGDQEFRLHFVEILTREMALDPHSSIYRSQARGLRRLWQHYAKNGKFVLAARYFVLWWRHEKFLGRLTGRNPDKPSLLS